MIYDEIGLRGGPDYRQSDYRYANRTLWIDKTYNNISSLARVHYNGAENKYYDMH